MPNLRFLSSITMTIVFVVTAGCDVTNTGANQEAFERDALQGSISGFTETDGDGTVVSDDEDDWRTAPVYAAGRFELDGAPVPNPYSETNGLKVSGFVNGSVAGGFLSLRRIQSGSLHLIDEESLGSTSRPFLFIDNGTWFTGVEPGLHRLVVMDAQNRVVTYGDIQVE